MKAGSLAIPGDRYEIGALLGEGGHSVVHRVRDLERRADLALKVLAPGVDIALGKGLMRREYLAMSGIHHPGVVEVHDFGLLPDERPFFTMELVEGTPLASYLAGAPEARILEVLLGVLDALDHIHRQGVVHGDIKPSNVLVRSGDDGPQVKLLDFGLAAFSRAPVLAAGAIRGSVAYLAPEVIRCAPVDGRADLYALGATLYESLAGHPLWAGDRPEEVLRKHLDVEPPPLRLVVPSLSTALERLIEKLLQKDARLRYATAGHARREVLALLGEKGPSGPDAARPMALAGSFVGRDEALEAVLAAVSHPDRGAVVVVEGGEGVGKSRLLSELRQRCGLRGLGTVLAPGGPAPYAPFRALVRALDRGGFASGAATMLGEAAGSPAGDGVEDASDLDAEGRKMRLYDTACRAIGEQLRAVASDGMVLLVDDLDRADAGSRDFLRFLARQIEHVPLGVVATVRAGTAPGSEGPEALPEGAIVVTLRALSLTDVGHLAASMLGVEEVPRQLASLIHEESAGNPADVEAFVRTLVDEGAVVIDLEGRVQLRESSLEKVPTPRRVQQWVERHVATLSAESRFALSVASLLPEPFAPSLLSEALGFPEELTYEVLGQLETQAVVRCREGSYAFTSRKLQRALAEGLASASRRDLSDRIARALLALRSRVGHEAASDALLAEYLEAGRRPQEAIPYLLAAASDATAVLALDDAVSCLKRAVARIISDDEGIDAELLAMTRERLADRLVDCGATADAAGIYETLLLDLDGAPKPAEPRVAVASVRVGMKLAKLHQRRGDHDRALERLRQVLGHLDRDRDAGVISDVLARIAWIYRAKGVTSEAVKYGGRALKAATESGETVRVANALNHVGAIHYQRGELPQAQTHYRRALLALAGRPHEDESGADDPTVLEQASLHAYKAQVIVNNLGNVHWKRGDWDHAVGFYGQALRLSEKLGHLSGVATASNNLALISFGRGRWEEAVTGFQRSLEIKGKLGESSGVAVGLNNLAEVYERVGRWREARESYEQSYEIKSRLGDSRGAGIVLLTLGNLYRKMGELELAGREISRGLQALEGVGDAEALAFGDYYRALLAKDREDFVAALRHLSEAMAVVERLRSFHDAGKIYTSAADLYFRMGDLDRAEEHANRSLELAGRLGDRYEEGKVLSVMGRIHYQRRNRTAAREAFERGIALLEELGARFELARSAYEYGLRIEDPARAARYLEKALGIFRSIGALADLERGTGTYDRIRQNLQGFDSPEPRGAGEVVGLYEISKTINSTLEWDEVLDRMMDLVLERTRADRGIILLVEAGGRLRVEAARNIAKENLKGISDISESIVKEVIRTQGPLLASNASLDPRFAEQKSIVLHGIVSIAAVPLVIRGRIAGAIYLDQLTSPDFFTQKDLKFLQAFADQAAIALENARLYRELRDASERITAENRVLRAEMRGRGSEIVGRSREFRQTLALLEKAAVTSETTLMLGESGTGKSFLARAIHDVGPRREGPFVKFNCAALPETLVEAELFGHEKGAFTGADKRKLGRFEIAGGGTVFLDEIGNVSLGVQAKLLRVLEDKEYERVGGTQTLKADVQIIAATNRDLPKAIREGAFREDLFYRLNIFPIRIPPLRERREDIPLLAERFLAGLATELGIHKRGFTPEAAHLMAEHEWPGNVRELESAVRRAAVLAEDELIGSEDLRFLKSAGSEAPRREVLLEEAIGPFVRAPRRGEKVFQAVTENVERVLIRKVLVETGGQIREASRRLGVARNTLKSKMRRYGLVGKDDGEGP